MPIDRLRADKHAVVDRQPDALVTQFCQQLDGFERIVVGQGRSGVVGEGQAGG